MDRRAAEGPSGDAAFPGLEPLVTRYRREAAAAPPGSGRNVELEVRLREVGAEAFLAVFGALRARGGGCVLSQTLTVVLPGRAEGGVRLVDHVFEGGVRRAKRFSRKTPLVPPLRFPAAGGAPAFAVALSAEAPEPGAAPAADERAVFRVKARASFGVELRGSPWRCDLSVVRQIPGSEATAALGVVVPAMFPRPPAGGAPPGPAAFLEALGLGGADAAAAAEARRYTFEVEAEFDPPAEGRDALRPGDVLAAADLLRGLAAPGFAGASALQAEVFRLARRLLRAPGLADRFRADWGLKRLLPQAVALTRADFRALYPCAGFHLTDKADGLRAVAVAREGEALVLSDRLRGPFPPAPGAPPEGAAGLTVLDGELVEGAEGAFVFYAFDAVFVGGADLSGEGFEARLARLAEGVALLRALGVPAEAKPFVRLPAGGGAPALERAFRAVRGGARPYAVDGLILVEPGRPYLETANYKWKSARDSTIDFLVRRAPASVRGRPPFVAPPGGELYFLFVGARPDLVRGLGLPRCPGYAELFPLHEALSGGGGGEYAPIQFAPSDAPLAFLFADAGGGAGGGPTPEGAEGGPAPEGAGRPSLDGAIAELRLAGFRAPGLPAWEVVRVRADRAGDAARGAYFGNDLRVAEFTWLNALDPLLFEELWAGPGGGPVVPRPPEGPHSAQAALLRFFKGRRIAADLAHAQWVVDLGAGRGQDLRSFLAAGVAHLVAVDRDRGGLAELVRRRYALAGARGDRRGPAGAAGRAGRSASPGRGRRGADAERGAPAAAAGTTLHVLVADAAAPAAETAAALRGLGLPAAGGDALVCNLAAHQFLADAEALANFAALALAAVRPGGAVVVTALDGAAVHARLRGLPPGGAWEASDPGAPPGAPKYSIRRLFASDRLEAAGQKVSVLLPFGGGQSEEFLVNLDALAAALAARGFAEVARGSAAAAAPDFTARDQAAGRRLTAADLSYLELFAEAVFSRRG